MQQHTLLHPFRRPRPVPSAAEAVARRLTRAVVDFEYRLYGRPPLSVTVVALENGIVVNLHERLAAIERGVATDDDGSLRVCRLHRDLFETSLSSLRDHLRCTTGIEVQAAIVHVDPATGSVLKTLSTTPGVDLFVIGEAAPCLGVPINAHRRA
jgi:uncharacterized protein YbcI